MKIGFVLPIKSPNKQAVQSKIYGKCNVISEDILSNAKLKNCYVPKSKKIFKHLHKCFYICLTMRIFLT